MRTLRLLLLSVLVPLGTSAQSLDTAAVARINDATQARLRLHGGSHGVVQKPQATPAGIAYDRGTFRTEGGNPVEPARPVPLSEILEIDVARGTQAGRGATIGAIAGGTLALLAALVTSGEDFVSLTPGEAVAAVAVWAAIGAGVGALIGSQSPRWHSVYRAAGT